MSLRVKPLETHLKMHNDVAEHHRLVREQLGIKKGITPMLIKRYSILTHKYHGGELLEKLSLFRKSLENLPKTSELNSELALKLRIRVENDMTRLAKALEVAEKDKSIKFQSVTQSIIGLYRRTGKITSEQLKSLFEVIRSKGISMNDAYEYLANRLKLNSPAREYLIRAFKYHNNPVEFNRVLSELDNFNNASELKSNNIKPKQKLFEGNSNKPKLLEYKPTVSKSRESVSKQKLLEDNSNKPKLLEYKPIEKPVEKKTTEKERKEPEKEISAEPDREYTEFRTILARILRGGELNSEAIGSMVEHLRKLRNTDPELFDDRFLELQDMLKDNDNILKKISTDLESVLKKDDLKELEDETKNISADTKKILSKLDEKGVSKEPKESGKEDKKDEKKDDKPKEKDWGKYAGAAATLGIPAAIVGFFIILAVGASKSAGANKVVSIPVAPVMSSAATKSTSFGIGSLFGGSINPLLIVLILLGLFLLFPKK